MVERSDKSRPRTPSGPSGPGATAGDDDDDEEATGPSLVPGQETASLLQPVREAARETLDEDDRGDDGERTGPSSTADLDGDEEPGGTLDVDEQESIRTAPTLQPLPQKRPRIPRTPTREKPPPPVPSQELPQVRELDARPREPVAKRPARKSPLAGDGFEADPRDVSGRRAHGLSAVSAKVLKAIEDNSPLNVAATVASLVLFLFVAWFLWDLLSR